MTYHTQAHGLVGQTTYRWKVLRWDPNVGENFELIGDEVGALTVARSAAFSAFVDFKRLHDEVHGEIRRGTYVEDELVDSESSPPQTVLDGSWERDENWSIQFTSDGEAGEEDVGD